VTLSAGDRTKEGGREEGRKEGREEGREGGSPYLEHCHARWEKKRCIRPKQTMLRAYP